MTEPIPINADRLWRSIMDLAAVGATDKGGNCRLALTSLDGQARDLVAGWMHEAGLEVRVDAIGNIFGRRAGSDPTARSVMTGSHIDTQPTGGKFDGCYGVLAGLEVMRTLNEQGIRTKAPVELAIWTNEEGSRFLPVMMGSGVFTGRYALAQVLASKDADGATVADGLDAIGYRGTHASDVRSVAAYIEAHIEQGPILEQQGKTIGVVTGSLGVRWFDVVVTGQEMHAGPTPMDVRRDALLAAAHLIQAVHTIAVHPGPAGRGTVGTIRVVPGSRNVVPGRVEFTVDLRHTDMPTLERMTAQWAEACRRTEAVCGVTVAAEEVQRFDATPFDEGLIAAVADAARRRGLPHMKMVTGAGHDAVNIAAVVPTAMVFIPCKDGVSHNESEDAQPEHVAAGCAVLLDTMLASAGVAG